MKKIVSILILFVIIWLAKLSYDFYGISENLTDLQNQLHQAEQKNANLNDQLIALQRAKEIVNTKDEGKASSKNINTQTAQGLSLKPSTNLKPQLELVQFALQQHQFVYALNKLNEIDESLSKYDLAESLQASMHTAISKDKQSIQQYVLARNVQLEQLQGVLTQIEQYLKNEQNNQNLNLSNSDKPSFWKSWFKVDVVGEQTPVIAQRKMILKEAQLKVLLAKHALERGQSLEYQNILDAVIGELNQLPDQNSQRIKNEIQKLKQTKVIPEVKLSSILILG